MGAAVHFESYGEGRANLKTLLDAAEQGRLATLQRDQRTAMVVDGERMRHFLNSVIPSRASAVPENDGWSVFIPGLPVSADGNSFDEAIAEMINTLRDYAEDWQARLRDASNHREHWGLVMLIALSTDEQLQAWLASGGPTAA
ncbi:Antitoxin of toxin-antitoxin, RelE / RelB, TA system [Lentzea fradiae]|uniref:Antitoxin of toxin-antitoxin, RelE / RelB, TA system n=1 Tax=Lentzea fradiae TaxID=200378 RepID=A0A1G7MSW6_9PSEU|nr:prevent-host-death protein [Lentzea fradiae]SDF64797.1 Antitoxin of toxin-antitoxin, RelE / RelB, TA system [Lentzea fradiae]